MGSFIFLIIVIWIVAAVLKSQKKSGKTVPNQPRQPQGQYPQRPAAGQMNSRPAGNTGYGQQGCAGNAASQQQLKNRLQQKYGSRPAAGYPVQNSRGQQNAAGDILTRAKNNVKENEQDIVRTVMQAGPQSQTAGRQTVSEQFLHNAGDPGKQDMSAVMQQNVPGAASAPESSELMKQINDLMVMGYSGNLTFERDFVAEGIEMLNRFEIPAN